MKRRPNEGNVFICGHDDTNLVHLDDDGGLTHGSYVDSDLEPGGDSTRVEQDVDIRLELPTGAQVRAAAHQHHSLAITES